MGRGPAQEDTRLFGPGQVAGLNRAVGDFAWLLSRGYAETSALKLVGDRYALRTRQRTAVLRCTCTDAQAHARVDRRIDLRADPDGLRGRELAVDGFNVLIAVESAMAGGVILRGRDGAIRDLASVHGSYRRSDQTLAALEAIGERLEVFGPRVVRWFLDRPVSNSGRLKTAIVELAQARGWPWSAELDFNPDRRLVALAPQDDSGDDSGDESGDEHGDPGQVVVATGDAWILDNTARHVDLAAAVIEAAVPDAWLLALGASVDEPRERAALP